VPAGRPQRCIFASSSQAALWTTRSACGQRRASDPVRLAGLAAVIHFSTAPSVHRYTAADQRVPLNHPQAYAQAASLAPRGWRDRSMLSCWPRGPIGESLSNALSNRLASRGRWT
jgi:hypothetical protein